MSIRLLSYREALLNGVSTRKADQPRTNQLIRLCERAIDKGWNWETFEQLAEDQGLVQWRRPQMRRAA